MELMRYHYSVICAETQKFFSSLKQQKINAYNISEKNSIVTLDIAFSEKRRFEKLCADIGAQAEIISKGRLIRAFEKAKKRSGLAVGAVICMAAMAIVKNYAVDIEILSDDEQIKASVMNVLYENGIAPGAYIPSIDLVKTERELKQNVGGISWAGISVTDCTLTIDVIEKLPQEKAANERMPSDLVASHDGVIEDIEIYNGLLVKPLGSGVLKGDVIVSGKIPIKKTELQDDKFVTFDTVKYVRSVGKIYGTYEQTQVFEQPLTDTKLTVTPKTKNEKYLNVFSCKIPLFFKAPSGFYITEENYQPLEILGVQTPVGITTAALNEYSFETTYYTKKQAKALAAQQRERYEKNFLADCEIKSRHTDVEYKKDRVVLTVKYKIYGEMGEESYFFINK